jgi:hypothetical protein
LQFVVGKMQILAGVVAPDSLCLHQVLGFEQAKILFVPDRAPEPVGTPVVSARTGPFLSTGACLSLPRAVRISMSGPETVWCGAATLEGYNGEGPRLDWLRSKQFVFSEIKSSAAGDYFFARRSASGMLSVSAMIMA